MATIWTTWNRTNTISTTSDWIDNTIWTTWTNSTATTTSISSNYIWCNWIESTEIVSATSISQIQHAPAVITADEQARLDRERRYWEERAREANARAAVEAERRVAAEKRAEELLISVLSEEQRKTFKTAGHFIVRRGDRRYRIRRGWSGNIDVVNKAGVLEHRLCIHPRESVPVCDNLVAQKLMLEASEDFLLSKANRHPLWDGERKQILPALH